MVTSTASKNKPRIGLLVSMILLALLASRSSSDAADKIRIGYSGVTVSNAMLWVTDEAQVISEKWY